MGNLSADVAAAVSPLQVTAGTQAGVASQQLQGGWNLPSSGAASTEHSYGNIIVARTMSSEAVRIKASSGQPAMGDSSTITPSEYPNADLADTSDSAYARISQVRTLAGDN